MTPKRDDAARLLFGVVVLLVLETVGRCSLSWLFGSSTWKTGGTWSSACQSAALSYVLAFGSSCNPTPPGEFLVATALGSLLGAVGGYLGSQTAVLVAIGMAVLLIHHPCPHRKEERAGSYPVDTPGAPCNLPTLGFWQNFLAAFWFVCRSTTRCGLATCGMSVASHVVALVVASELRALLGPPSSPDAQLLQQQSSLQPQSSAASQQRARSASPTPPTPGSAVHAARQLGHLGQAGRGQTTSGSGALGTAEGLGRLGTPFARSRAAMAVAAVASGTAPSEWSGGAGIGLGLGAVLRRSSSTNVQAAAGGARSSRSMPGNVGLPTRQSAGNGGSQQEAHWLARRSMPAPAPQLPSTHVHASAGASPGSRLWQRTRTSGSLRPVGSAPHLPSAASTAISGGSGSLRGAGSGPARGPAVQDPPYNAEQGAHLQAAGGERICARAPDPRVVGSGVGVPSSPLAVNSVVHGVAEEQSGVLLGASPDGSCTMAGVQGGLLGKAAGWLRSREGEDSAMEIGGAAGDVSTMVSLPGAAHQQERQGQQQQQVAAQGGILARAPSSMHPDDVATLISTEVALAAAAAGGGSHPSHGDGEGHAFSSELFAEGQAAASPAEVCIQSLDGCAVAGGGCRDLGGQATGAAAIPGAHACEVEEEEDGQEDEDSEVDDSSDDCFSLALDMGAAAGGAAVPGHPSPRLPFPQPPAGGQVTACGHLTTAVVLPRGPIATVPGAVMQLPLDVDLYGCDVADLQDLEDLMSLEEVEAATGEVPAEVGAVKAGESLVQRMISPVGAVVVPELVPQESGGLGPRPAAGGTVLDSSMAGEGDGSSRTAGNSPVGVGAAGVRLQYPGALGSTMIVGGALPLQADVLARHNAASDQMSRSESCPNQLAQLASARRWDAGPAAGTTLDPAVRLPYVASATSLDLLDNFLRDAALLAATHQQEQQRGQGAGQQPGQHLRQESGEGQWAGATGGNGGARRTVSQHVDGVRACPHSEKPAPMRYKGYNAVEAHLVLRQQQLHAAERRHQGASSSRAATGTVATDTLGMSHSGLDPSGAKSGAGAAGRGGERTERRRRKAQHHRELSAGQLLARRLYGIADVITEVPEPYAPAGGMPPPSALPYLVVPAEDGHGRGMAAVVPDGALASGTDTSDSSAEGGAFWELDAEALAAAGGGEAQSAEDLPLPVAVLVPSSRHVSRRPTAGAEDVIPLLAPAWSTPPPGSYSIHCGPDAPGAGASRHSHEVPYTQPHTLAHAHASQRRSLGGLPPQMASSPRDWELSRGSVVASGWQQHGAAAAGAGCTGTAHGGERSYRRTVSMQLRDNRAWHDGSAGAAHGGGHGDRVHHQHKQQGAWRRQSHHEGRSLYEGAAYRGGTATVAGHNHHLVALPPTTEHEHQHRGPLPGLVAQQHQHQHQQHPQHPSRQALRFHSFRHHSVSGGPAPAFHTAQDSSAQQQYSGSPAGFRVSPAGASAFAGAGASAFMAPPPLSSDSESETFALTDAPGGGRPAVQQYEYFQYQQQDLQKQQQRERELQHATSTHRLSGGGATPRSRGTDGGAAVSSPRMVTVTTTLPWPTRDRDSRHSSFGGSSLAAVAGLRGQQSTNTASPGGKGRLSLMGTPVAATAGATAAGSLATAAGQGGAVSAGASAGTGAMLPPAHESLSLSYLVSLKKHFAAALAGREGEGASASGGTGPAAGGAEGAAGGGETEKGAAEAAAEESNTAAYDHDESCTTPRPRGGSGGGAGGDAAAADLPTAPSASTSLATRLTLPSVDGWPTPSGGSVCLPTLGTGMGHGPGAVGMGVGASGGGRRSVSGGGVELGEEGPADGEYQLRRRRRSSGSGSKGGRAGPSDGALELPMPPSAEPRARQGWT